MRQPLYLQIQEYFKEQITSNKLKEHDKIPSGFAKRIGLRIKDEFSILTFDDPSSGDDSGIFTHIARSEEEMGREAAKILLDLLESKVPQQPKNYRKVMLEPKLVLRETTGFLQRSVR